MATTEPKLEQRNEQPYAAMRRQVTMQEIGSVLPPLIGEVFGWLERRGAAPAGPPFFRYLVIDMVAQLVIEVGVPTETIVPGDSDVSTGVLPAGRYAVLVHTGHPSELVDATAKLLAWGQENGIVWQASKDQREWAARIEFYLTDPAEEPDMQKWQTELAFLVAET